MDGLCFCADSGLLFLFLARLAGTRPGGRHPFLSAQERMQRRRAAQLWHRRTHYAPCGRCVRAAAVSQIGGARWGAGSCTLTDALWPPRAASLAAQLQPGLYARSALEWQVLLKRELLPLISIGFYNRNKPKTNKYHRKVLSFLRTPRCSPPPTLLLIAAEAAQQAKHPPKKRIHQGATTQTTPTASCLARRSCLSAAPAGREASFTAQAAQHAFFADFLARARKLVARRGETRPAALKKAATDTKAAQRA